VVIFFEWARDLGFETSFHKATSKRIKNLGLEERERTGRQRRGKNFMKTNSIDFRFEYNYPSQLPYHFGSQYYC